MNEFEKLKKILEDTSPTKMDESVWRAYQKDFRAGHITVGKICDANCFFCSQKWNPPGVVKELNRFLTIEEIEYLLENHLEKDKGVTVIGVGLHVPSGEFFFHPNALEILNMIRSKGLFKGRPNIFTNGNFLTEDIIKYLKKLDIHITLSLNTSIFNTRIEIMSGGKRNQTAINSISLMKKYDLPFRISLIPIRNLFRTGDMDKTIKFLKMFAPINIVMNRTGYTKLTPFQVAEELNLTEIEILNEVRCLSEINNINIEFDLLDTENHLKYMLNKFLNYYHGSKISKCSKLFLYSSSVKDFFNECIRTSGISNYKTKMVSSTVFGGNISASGLLFVEDYEVAISEFLKDNEKPDFFVMPSSSFDTDLEDISMVNVMSLKEKYKIDIILV